MDDFSKFDLKSLNSAMRDFGKVFGEKEVHQSLTHLKHVLFIGQRGANALLVCALTVVLSKGNCVCSIHVAQF